MLKPSSSGWNTTQKLKTAVTWSCTKSINASISCNAVSLHRNVRGKTTDQKVYGLKWFHNHRGVNFHTGELWHFDHSHKSVEKAAAETAVLTLWFSTEQWGKNIQWFIACCLSANCTQLYCETKGKKIQVYAEYVYWQEQRTSHTLVLRHQQESFSLSGLTTSIHYGREALHFIP